MNQIHKITVHNRDTGDSETVLVPNGENILQAFESQGKKLPFSCRNGCCTTCAVRLLSGNVDQSMGIGLSKKMQAEGYSLICIATAVDDLVFETLDEDEVYERQFGNYLEKIKSSPGNPMEI